MVAGAGELGISTTFTTPGSQPCASEARTTPTRRPFTFPSSARSQSGTSFGALVASRSSLPLMTAVMRAAERTSRENGPI